MSKSPEYEIERVVFRDAVRLPCRGRPTTKSWGADDHGLTSVCVATQAGSVTITGDRNQRVLVPAANVAAIEERPKAEPKA